MSKERMPKKEYFELRLKQAIENGDDRKATYYRTRLEHFRDDLHEGELTESEINQERITLQPAGLFGSRKTLEEAFEYADMMSKSSSSPIHAITPVYVLYNTIAEQYDLIPKKVNE